MPRILLVGDPMIDRYWFCSARRLSPEAPIVNWVVQNTIDKLGGAANVLANLVSLSRIFGSTTEIVFASCIPKEIMKVIEDLNLSKISAKETCKSFDLDRPPTIKNRIIDEEFNQHQARFDLDHRQKNLEEHQQSMINWIQSQEKFDVGIVSDYEHGQITPALVKIVAKSCDIVIADPKGDDRTKYSGVKVITPNLKEVQQLIPGNKSTLEKARQLGSDINSEVVQKIGKDGCTIVYKNKIHHFKPFDAGKMIDPTGAGDTFISMLGFQLAQGKTLTEAVSKANTLAGISVTKTGCYIPQAEDISKWKITA